MHQNEGLRENEGVHQNKENMNAPQNYHYDPHNDPIIKTVNIIDAAGDEDENESLKEAPVENDDENQDSESKENKIADAGCENRSDGRRGTRQLSGRLRNIKRHGQAIRHTDTGKHAGQETKN